PEERSGARRPESGRFAPEVCGQPPETSWGLALPAPIQGIIDRSWVPTSSIGCWRDLLRSSLNFGRPFWFSAIHSLAKEPLWISERIFFISARVWSVTIRGP